jgi:hypothetical protein
MEVMGWVRILRKRWWLTLLLLLLTLAAVAALAARPGPYTAESQISLLPSQHISGPAGGNPYLSFGDSETLTADLLRREMTAPAAVTRLAAAGYSSSYLVTDDPSAGQVLDITVTGSSKATVEHTLQGVTAAASTTLAGMQAGLNSSEQITSIVVSLAPEAKLSVGKKARTLIVVFAAGFVFTIALPQALDAAFSRRRARRFGVTPSPAKLPKAAPESVRATSLDRPAENPVEAVAEPPERLQADSESDNTIILSPVRPAVPVGYKDRISQQWEKADKETAQEATEL